MRNKLAFVAIAAVVAQFAGAQTLGIGSKAPQIKPYKVVQGKNPVFGDGKLHVIEMFATW